MTLNLRLPIAISVLGRERGCFNQSPDEGGRTLIKYIV